MSDLGQALAAYIAGTIVVAAVIGAAIGMALMLAVPWIWNHVHIWVG